MVGQRLTIIPKGSATPPKPPAAGAVGGDAAATGVGALHLGMGGKGRHERFYYAIGQESQPIDALKKNSVTPLLT